MHVKNIGGYLQGDLDVKERCTTTLLDHFKQTNYMSWHSSFKLGQPVDLHLDEWFGDIFFDESLCWYFLTGVVTVIVPVILLEVRRELMRSVVNKFVGPSNRPKKRDLSQEEIKQHEEMFKSFDRDESGDLCDVEVHQMMEKLGITISFSDVVEMITHADANHDGVVDFKEFCDLVGRVDNDLWAKATDAKACRRLCIHDARMHACVHTQQVYRQLYVHANSTCTCLHRHAGRGSVSENREESESRREGH